MSDDRGDLIAALNRFSDRAESLLRTAGSSSTAIAHGPPPDKGSSIVVIACAVLVGMNIFLSGALVVMAVRMFDLDDKLSAIYMMAPHLKPTKEASK